MLRREVAGKTFAYNYVLISLLPVLEAGQWVELPGNSRTAEVTKINTV